MSDAPTPTPGEAERMPPQCQERETLPRPARTVSVRLFILAMLATALLAGAAGYFWPKSDTLTQKGAVNPGALRSGVVFFPLPYVFPPNLKIDCAERTYEITEHGNLGFTWRATDSEHDFRKLTMDEQTVALEEWRVRWEERNRAQGFRDRNEELRFEAELRQRRVPKEKITYEAFTWEAVGLRARIDAQQKPGSDDGVKTRSP